jgi:hypothetical protein
MIILMMNINKHDETMLGYSSQMVKNLTSEWSYIMFNAIVFSNGSNFLAKAFKIWMTK